MNRIAPSIAASNSDRETLHGRNPDADAAISPYIADRMPSVAVNTLAYISDHII